MKTLEDIVTPAAWAAADRVRDDLVPAVDAFRSRQSRSGTVEAPTAGDRAAVEEIAAVARGIFDSIGRADQAAALDQDIASWLERGLDAPPQFDRSRDAFRKVEDGELVLFVGVTASTNSASAGGSRFEVMFGQRHQPELLRLAAQVFPHPHDVVQELVLLAGSAGFVVGNCIVFFPESVAAATKVDVQEHATLIMSKFQRIHEDIAHVNATALLEPAPWTDDSVGLDAYHCYEIRCLWAYLHDRAHFTGAWPIGDNTALKMNWFIGLLEEIKVDAKSILMARYGDVPYLDELFAMIVIERLFRYPLEPRPERNFDAGTGVFLYSYLLRSGAVQEVEGRVRVDKEGTIAALVGLVADIETMEQRSATPDEYRANARAMVREHLAEADDPKDKYAFQPHQEILRSRSDVVAAQEPLDFSQLAAAPAGRSL